MFLLFFSPHPKINWKFYSFTILNFLSFIVCVACAEYSVITILIILLLILQSFSFVTFNPWPLVSTKIISPYASKCWIGSFIGITSTHSNLLWSICQTCRRCSLNDILFNFLQFILVKKEKGQCKRTLPYPNSFVVGAT